MLDAKIVFNTIVDNVDESVKSFIRRNQDILREITLWGGYYATDHALSLKAFGIDNEEGGFYRVYDKKDQDSQNFSRNVILAGKLKIDNQVSYINIIVRPDLSYDFYNPAIKTSDKITLCKDYCTLYKLLPVLQAADLRNIIPDRIYDDEKYKESLKVVFTNDSCDKITHIINNSNPGHWAHGNVYYTFIYDNKYIVDVEAYDSEAYCSVRSNQIRELNFLRIYDINGNFMTSLNNTAIPGFDPHRRSIIGKIDLDDILKYLFVREGEYIYGSNYR